MSPNYDPLSNNFNRILTSIAKAILPIQHQVIIWHTVPIRIKHIFKLIGLGKCSNNTTTSFLNTQHNSRLMHAY